MLTPSVCPHSSLLSVGHTRKKRNSGVRKLCHRVKKFAKFSNKHSSNDLIDVESYLLSHPVAVGEDFERIFCIRNNSSKDLARGELLLKREGSSYFAPSAVDVPAVRARAEMRVSMRFRVSGGMTIDDLPSSYTVEYTTGSTKITSSRYHSMCKHLPSQRQELFDTCRLGDFIGKLKQFKPNPSSGSPRLNILLFGLAGATKSSFVNSVLTLLNDKDTVGMVHTAVSGGGSDHVTTKLNRFDLPGTDIALWDCWGLTGKTFKGNELQMILQVSEKQREDIEAKRHEKKREKKRLGRTFLSCVDRDDFLPGGK